jgi:PleD family two-component response regulator
MTTGLASSPSVVPADILVVDCDVHQPILVALGKRYRVSLATSGSSAIHRLGDAPLSLLICDTGIRDIHPAELCRIAKRLSLAPAVLVTEETRRP